MIRVLAPPTYAGMTKTVKTTARAEDRARWVALATGSAEIQQRDGRTEDWTTLVRFTKSERGRVERRTGR
jgi:hypothetical protein